MPYKAKNQQKNTYFHNKIENPLELPSLVPYFICECFDWVEEESLSTGGGG
jgi:hypothetical protein